MDISERKYLAAAEALTFVKEGMVLGIGTGSTANAFIELLGKKCREGFSVCGVATSLRSAQLCKAVGVPLVDIEQAPPIDLTIDGADEVDPQLNLIKGGGGALLQEKIVAQASKTMLVIADSTKLVTQLGRFPLPIEVNVFGVALTKKLILSAAERLGLRGTVSLRMQKATPFKTDCGHYILDADFGCIPNPHLLSTQLLELAGVVQHGLFLGVARHALIAGEDGKIQIKHAPAAI